MSKEG